MIDRSLLCLFSQRTVPYCCSSIQIPTTCQTLRLGRFYLGILATTASRPTHQVDADADARLSRIPQDDRQNDAPSDQMVSSSSKKVRCTRPPPPFPSYARSFDRDGKPTLLFPCRRRRCRAVCSLVYRIWLCFDMAETLNLRLVLGRSGARD